MSVKLNHYWSIIPGKYNEYEKFLIKKFIPGVNALNLHTVAGWSVLVGEYSEIILENACKDLELVEKALKTRNFRKLKQELFYYVRSYQTKVLVNKGITGSYSIDIREGTVKFNQMWDIQSDKQEEYNDFFYNEYIPVLKEIGVSVAGEWEILIGDCPGIICEGRVSDVNNLISNLQSKKIQNAKNRLMQVIENYKSRILNFHVQKIKGYKSASYKLISS